MALSVCRMKKLSVSGIGVAGRRRNHGNSDLPIHNLLRGGVEEERRRKKEGGKELSGTFACR